MHRRGVANLAGDQEVARHVTIDRESREAGRDRAVRRAGGGLLAVLERQGMGEPILIPVRVGGIADQHLVIDVHRRRVAVVRRIPGISREARRIVGTDHAVAERGRTAAGRGPRRQVAVGEGGRTDDGDARALVIRGDDGEGIRVRVHELADAFDRVVELDGIEDPALAVHVMRLLVDGGALDHEDEAIRVLALVAQHGQRLVGHLVQHRLKREAIGIDHRLAEAGSGHATTAVDLVIGHVHVGERKQAEDLVGVRRHAVEVRAGGGVGEAGILELLEEIAGRSIRGGETSRAAPSRGEFVREVAGITGAAGRADRAGGQEPLATATHQNLQVRVGDDLIEVLIADAGTGAAIGGVGPKRRRSGVEDIRRGDDAKRLALGAAQEFAHGFHAGIIERIERVVGEHVELIVVALVAVGITAGSGGGVGHNRVQRGGFHHAGDGEQIHRKRRLRLAVDDAVLDDAGRRAVRRAHAVADHDDDVLGAIAAGGEADDLEVAAGCRGGLVALFHDHAQLMHARGQVRIVAEGNDCRAGRQTRRQTGGDRSGDGDGVAGGIRGGDGLAIDEEDRRGDARAAAGARGDLEVEMLTGEEPGDDGIGLVTGEERTRRGEPGDARGSLHGGGGGHQGHGQRRALQETFVFHVVSGGCWGWVD